MKYFLILLTAVSMISCIDEEMPKDYFTQNETDIDKYIEDNNLDPIKTESGLRYIIEEEGTGDFPEDGSEIVMKYKGTFLNGNVFDQSGSDNYTTFLYNLIYGFREGLKLMKEGSKAKLIVPFHIAYGYSDTQGIPIGSVLVFDIEVIAINEGIDFLTKNEEDIAEYIEENNLDPIKTESGLYYIIEEQGEGDFPTETSKVTVRYEGYFLNGDVFSRNTTDGITTTLDKVIPGWKEGIQLFKEGGKGKLIIPFNLGYGYVRKSTIPVGSVLVFNIELTDVSL